MGRFVYGPYSFVVTFLLGFAAVAAAGYFVTLRPVDLQLSGPQCIEVKDPTGTDELEDEWAVYQALINEERLGKSHILIQDDSLSDHLSTDDSPTLRTASVGAIIDYRDKNREEHSLKGLFADKASFITTKEIESFPDNSSGSWGPFVARIQTHSAYSRFHASGSITTAPRRSSALFIHATAFAIGVMH